MKHIIAASLEFIGATAAALSVGVAFAVVICGIAIGT